jgi:hypothetical protein
VYLSNNERIRLGLQAWGSDVPDDVVAEAERALAEAEQALVGAVCPAPEACPATPPKRARSTKGQFQADDPATPEVDEAFVEG